MGIGSFGLIFVIAAVMAGAAQLVRVSWLRSPRTSYDWAIVGVVSLGLGIFVGVVKAIGPQWDGLYVFPAVAAAFVWAVIADGLLRYVGRPEAQPEA
jgi:hypothetical protein